MKAKIYLAIGENCVDRLFVSADGETFYTEFETFFIGKICLLRVIWAKADILFNAEQLIEIGEL